jgi:3-hydroxyisobutyrate dehydrogenase-like beta-hydroxyacid dehydrogenase
MIEKTGKAQITFIGTGAMGKPMVRELMKSGYPVKVNDKLWTKKTVELSNICAKVSP